MNEETYELKSDVFESEKLNKFRSVWMWGRGRKTSKVESSILSSPIEMSFKKVEMVFEKFHALDEQVYYFELISNVAALERNGIFDYFMKLPKDRSKNYILNFRTSYDWEIDSYIKAIFLLESKGLAENYNDNENNEEFDAVLEDYWEIVEKFVDRRVSYMLRAIYGEKIMTDFLRQVTAENSKIPFHELMELLKDWERMSEYPLDWGVALMNENQE